MLPCPVPESLRPPSPAPRMLGVLPPGSAAPRRHTSPACSARGKRRACSPDSGAGRGGGSAARQPPLLRHGEPEDGGRKGGRSRERRRLTRLPGGRRLPGSGGRGSSSLAPPPSPLAPRRGATRLPAVGALTSSAGLAAGSPTVTAAHCLPGAGSGCYLRAPRRPLRAGSAPDSAAAVPGCCQCAGPAPPRRLRLPVWASICRAARRWGHEDGERTARVSFECL